MGHMCGMGLGCGLDGALGPDSALCTGIGHWEPRTTPSNPTYAGIESQGPGPSSSFPHALRLDHRGLALPTLATCALGLDLGPGTDLSSPPQDWVSGAWRCPIRPLHARIGYERAEATSAQPCMLG